MFLAERGGFEPPIRLPVCRISSAVLSTTQPPLRKRFVGVWSGAGAVIGTNRPAHKPKLLCNHASRLDFATTVPYLPAIDGVRELAPYVFGGLSHTRWSPTNRRTDRRHADRTATRNRLDKKTAGRSASSRTEHGKVTKCSQSLRLVVSSTPFPPKTC